MFEFYNRLGFNTPFYINTSNQIVVEREFANAVEHLQTPLQLDLTAIIEIISRYHCFADRTLVAGISRTPWMARPNADATAWEYAQLPPHGDVVMSPQEVAHELFMRLQGEILEYCTGRSTIGILLSGGMDSRMVAGVVDHLIKTRQLAARVVAITWGMEQTRDVRYAQQIAQRLGWEWVHFPISPQTLLDNITQTAKRGCEYSPVHLHAMPNVREMNGIDCILGASYGDSVGRAEYSGRLVTKLEPFENYTLNWFQFLRTEVYRHGTAMIAQDTQHYRAHFPQPQPYPTHEIDWQAHYMRRKLNHCMGVIGERIPLFQIFTSPAVFGFMWSLSPRVRNDEVYQHLLGLFRTNVADIPWARDGRVYLSNGAPCDDLPSLHHRYGEWIRGDLYETIRDKALSKQVQQLGIFNMQAIESALTLNRKLTHQIHTTKIDEVAIWLAALADFVERFDIQEFQYEGKGSQPSLADVFNGMVMTPLQVAGLSVTKRLLARN